MLVKNAQIDLVVSIMTREKDRMTMALMKNGDQDCKNFIYNLSRVTDKSIERVAAQYYQACAFAYEPIFFAWRNKIHEFEE